MSDQDAMPPFSDPSTRHFCESDGVVGELTLNDNRMILRLADFSSPSLLQTPDGLDKTVTLEDGRVATLKGCVRLLMEQMGGDGWLMEAMANHAIIGPEEWPDDRIIRCVRFAFHGAEVALRYGEHVLSERGEQNRRERSLRPFLRSLTKPSWEFSMCRKAPSESK